MITQKDSKTLKRYPVISKEEAEEIEYDMRFKRNVRKTFELNGVYYDIRDMTDEHAERVYQDLSNR